MKKLNYLILILMAISCRNNRNADKQNEDWQVIKRYAKTINNITYSFPSSAQAEDRLAFVNKCQEAINDNLSIIEEKEFSDTIEVEFLETRDDMKKYIGFGAKGIAFPDRKLLFLITNHTNPPIRHELMHMVVMSKWGYPHPTSKWINEGLATYAAKTCNGLTVEEIYYYLLKNNMLISISDLSGDFYSNSEMIAYHQCGYLVEYLMEKYELGLLRRLWSEGIESFEKIYTKSFNDILADIDIHLENKQIECPDIDWIEFDKGCD